MVGFPAAVVNTAIGSDQAWVNRQAEEMLADGLENRELRLCLLRHCVHVAEPALERIALENRRGAGSKVGGLDDLPRLLAGVNRRHAQLRALFQRDGVRLRSA